MTPSFSKWIAGLVVGAAIAWPTVAAAQNVAPTNAPSGSRTPGISQRQRNQQQRIRQGVRSGQLTRGETRRLEAQQGRIQADKMVAKSDGQVTRQERRQIHREQNRASKNVYRLKHNKRTAVR